MDPRHLVKQPVLISRRKLLGFTAVGAGIAISGCVDRTSETKQSPVAGVQLYTLRDSMAESVSETLANVAKIGYTHVEFAGYFGVSPTDVRDMLSDQGLSAPSAHVPLETLQDNFEAAVEAALIIGHEYLVVPYLTEEQRSGGIDTYKRLAEQFNRWGEQCSQVGLKFAYHNHDFEFLETDGQIPYDLLLEQTHPDHVFMELDLYWTVKAKHRPVSYFERYPGRFPLWHVKDMSESGDFADVGQGVINFQQIFDAKAVAGFEYGFVERDVSPDPMRSVERGFSGYIEAAS